MEYAKGVFSSLKTFNIHNAYTHANAYVTTQYLDQTEPKQFELKFHPGIYIIYIFSSLLLIIPRQFRSCLHHLGTIFACTQNLL